MWGPTPNLSFYSEKYFVLFVDNFSRYRWLFPIKQKHEVLATFVEFHKLVEKQFQTKIINFQSDWGGEFCPVNTYLKENGTQHRITCSHTHQQNG